MFARYGYDGTIMDNLAKRCGANKASIYYHHNDKATLYENSLIALFTPIADAVVKAVDSEDDPIGKLESHIRAFAKASAEKPEFGAILMREMASGGVNMPARAREQMQRILFLLNQILKLGASQDRLKEADPLIIHFMILGTINLFVASIPMRRSLPASDHGLFLRGADIETATDQICETIVSSLLIQ
jgi:AcrR family transcriptional regulator